MNLEALNKELSDLREILAASPYTMAEAREAQEAQAKLVQDFLAAPEGPEKSKLAEQMVMESEQSRKAYFAQVADQIARFEETLNADLFIAEKRFIAVAGGDLINPAGFAPDSRVYINPGRVLQFDTRPTSKDVPAGATWKVYDLAE